MDWLSIRLRGTMEDQRHTENLSEHNEHIPITICCIYVYDDLRLFLKH